MVLWSQEGLLRLRRPCQWSVHIHHTVSVSYLKLCLVISTQSSHNFCLLAKTMPKSGLQIQSKHRYAVFQDELIYMVVWIKSVDAIPCKRAHLYSHVYYELLWVGVQQLTRDQLIYRDMWVKCEEAVLCKRDSSCVWTCKLKMEMSYFTRGLFT